MQGTSHRLYRKTVAEVLAELKDAGLDSMPGGGAEIFAKETRDNIIQGKADARQWLDVMREAHHQGIPTNATMRQGFVPARIDRRRRRRHGGSERRACRG